MNFNKIRPNILYWELKKILPNKFSILDVGCGSNSILKLFKKHITKSFGIDIHQKSIEISQKNKIHTNYICDNVINLKKYFKNKSIDVVYSIDVIEHLKKTPSILLIHNMESIAKKIIIIRTTNGFINQDNLNNNIHQKHLSGFYPSYFSKRGYKLIGIDGPYFLRVNKSKKIRPANLFLSIFANILNPIYRYLPQYSFNFLAYKFL